MRVYKKRTNREAVPEDVMKAAISMVMKNRNKKGFSIRKVGKMHKINYTTLSRYLKKYQEAAGTNDEQSSSDDHDNDMDNVIDNVIELFEYRKIPGQVFSRENEAVLIEYTIRYSHIISDLRPKHIRHMAYQCAIKFNANHPLSWDRNKKAGEDWFTSFLRRNKDMVPLTCEVKRPTRAVSIKRDIDKFYENLQLAYTQSEFAGENVYDVNVSTVTKILSTMKKSSQKSSNSETTPTTPESGDTISVVTAVNALGEFLAPMFIFARKRFLTHLIKNGPENSIGAANPTGTLTEECFLTFINHIVKYAKPSAKNPVLLILDDNTANLLSITILDLCHKESITLVSPPDHSRDKLQPLHVAIAGSFKDFCVISSNDWIRDHPEKRMTVQDLPGIVKTSLQRMMPANIADGFARTGIYPFRPEAFDEIDIAPHFMANGQEIQQQQQHPQQEHQQLPQQPPHQQQPQLQHQQTMNDNIPLVYPDFGYFM